MLKGIIENKKKVKFTVLALKNKKKYSYVYDVTYKLDDYIIQGTLYNNYDITAKEIEGYIISIQSGSHQFIASLNKFIKPHKRKIVLCVVKNICDFFIYVQLKYYNNMDAYIRIDELQYQLLHNVLQLEQEIYASVGDVIGYNIILCLGGTYNYHYNNNLKYLLSEKDMGTLKNNNAVQVTVNTVSNQSITVQFNNHNYIVNSNMLLYSYNSLLDPSCNMNQNFKVNDKILMNIKNVNIVLYCEKLNLYLSTNLLEQSYKNFQLFNYQQINDQGQEVKIYYL